MNHHHSASAARQSGLSLIELMITVAIGSFILLGLTTLASSSSRNEAEISRAARQLDNARYALQVISDDVRMAGFFGVLFDQGTPDADALQLCRAPSATVIEEDISLPVVGVNNNTADNPTGSMACTLDSPYTGTGTVGGQGTDVISIRRTHSRAWLTTELGTLTDDDLTWFVQTHPSFDVRVGTGGAPETPSPAAFYTYNFSNGDEAPVRQVLNHTYYVQEPGNAPCTGTTGAPCLVRIVLDESGGYTSELIAEGVENMQILYGLDSDDDGVANSYGIPANATEWASVVTARIWLLVRNSEFTVGHNDQKVYNLGGGVSVGPIGDRFKRNVYTTTINIVNVSNRRGTVSGI